MAFLHQCLSLLKPANKLSSLGDRLFELFGGGFLSIATRSCEGGGGDQSGIEVLDGVLVLVSSLDHHRVTAPYVHLD